MPNLDKQIVLVTGASGQLGRKLVPRFLSAGYHVKTHYRTPDKAARHCPPEAEPVYGDMLEPKWLFSAARGCHAVIHCAAMVSLRPGPSELMRKVNVEGTKAVIAACREQGVKRLIYISSIVTVGASENGHPVDERARFNLPLNRLPYIDTKREAEKAVLGANSAALETVVVNPSIMISPPNRELTKKDLRKIPRFIPFYFDFWINLVETDDVVSGILSALRRGRPGQRYLLTGENIDATKAFEFAREFLNIKTPRIKIPVCALYPVALAAEIYARIRRKRPKFHRGLASLAHHKFVYNSEKAKSELGFSPSSLRETLVRIAPVLFGRK